MVCMENTTMAATQTNPHEALARRRKALSILTFCQGHGIDSVTLGDLRPDAIELLARLSGVAYPSAETLAIVSGHLARAEEIAADKKARAAAADADPFAGLL